MTVIFVSEEMVRAYLEDQCEFLNREFQVKHPEALTKCQLRDLPRTQKAHEFEVRIRNKYQIRVHSLSIQAIEVLMPYENHPRINDIMQAVREAIRAAVVAHLDGTHRIAKGKGTTIGAERLKQVVISVAGKAPRKARKPRAPGFKAARDALETAKRLKPDGRSLSTAYPIIGEDVDKSLYRGRQA